MLLQHSTNLTNAVFSSSSSQQRTTYSEALVQLGKKDLCLHASFLHHAAQWEKKGWDSVDASRALLCAVVGFPPWAMGILSSVRSGRSPLHRRAFGLSGSGSLAQAVS